MEQKECMNLAVINSIIPGNKIIKTVREPYSEAQKGPKDLKILCDFLDTTTKTGLFSKIHEAMLSVPCTGSLLTIAADDSGETNLVISQDGKILGVSDIEMPKLRRYSMMFYPYLFEGVNCLFYKSRIGQDYLPHENMMVLPYFVILYAIKHSEELFEEKSIKAALSIFIGNVYSGLTEGICDVRSGVSALAGVLGDKTSGSIFDHVDLNNTKIHMIGMVKAITLYEMCEQNGDFDAVLSSVYNSELMMGNEIDFSDPNLDIKSDFLFNAYRKFLLNNYECLRNVGDPDEYKSIEITFGKDEFSESYTETREYKDRIFRYDLDSEYYKSEADLVLYIVPESKEYGESFLATLKEVYWKFGTTMGLSCLPCIEFYKFIYGKNNVIFYRNQDEGVLWTRTLENGEEFEFDLAASHKECRYVWKKVEKSLINKEYVDEISTRLSLTL